MARGAGPLAGRARTCSSVGSQRHVHCDCNVNVHVVRVDKNSITCATALEVLALPLVSKILKSLAVMLFVTPTSSTARTPNSTAFVARLLLKQPSKAQLPCVRLPLAAAAAAAAAEP